ncbi:cytochrome P450 78A11-like [Nymphaea colorata]|nr:cytochrome P450 78A11-like [Nymphaea colorata]
MKMDVGTGSPQPAKDPSWFLYTLSAMLGSKTFGVCDGWGLLSLAAAFLASFVLSWWFTSGGIAWRNGRNSRGLVPIPGPRGLPMIGSLHALSVGLAHRTLRAMVDGLGAKQLMAFSLGSTPAVVASEPQTAREILTSPHFADRPIKLSARQLMFERAMGFAPSGSYWKLLRRIAASHLFAPRRIAAHEPGRQADAAIMLRAIAAEQRADGIVSLRRHLQLAALNNIMGSVFGRRYEVSASSEDREVTELREMVREGFDLLGAFNWSDFLPWLGFICDPHGIRARCAALVPRVRAFVSGVICEHKMKRSSSSSLGDAADFVDVLLTLEGEEKLQEDDMIAVLWEMIFRGTDTTALLTEWVMAELVLNPHIQEKLQRELDEVVGKERSVEDADVAKLPYLQAVVKETLRVHPPGPLLSWARLSTSDVQLSNGMVVPAGTTAMVNMWAITHDGSVWEDAGKFRPERFVEREGGECVDVRGNDLRLAPFGAGRRVCPGKNLGLVTVSLWVAKLVHHFSWAQAPGKAVDLSEVLKLACEMKHPLCAVAVPRGVAL